MESDNFDQIKGLEEKLSQLNSERAFVLSELTKLRKKEGSALPPLVGKALLSSVPKTPDEKIQFFLKLFRCREDVYPKLWENNKTGKKGYSPVCNNEWVQGICDKPKVKCSDCTRQAFAPLNEMAVKDHLQGRVAIGTYAIREDNTCSFIAADFDKESWAEDVISYKNAARELGVEVAVERSRSGNGAHAWIFFQSNIQARIARQLGTIILTLATSLNRRINLKSYDRFFPNQDYIPKGGYGNLIALPLQHKIRLLENNVFVDDDLKMIEEQWSYLSNIKALSYDDIDIILSRALPKNSTNSIAEFDDLDIQFAEKTLNSISKKLQTEVFEESVSIRIKDQIYINMEGLPNSLISGFKRTATFANPEFFRMQRMRFSTWKTPRYIFCGDFKGDELILPRGCLDLCLDLSNQIGANVNTFDERPSFKKIKVKFKGKLRADQQKSVKETLKFDTGVLVAPPGVGKTVMGCYLIAKRKLPTLILVHRRPLMDQWIDRLKEFLDIDPKEIGSFGGSRKKPKGKIDLVMLQTLSNLEDSEEFLSQYGQVIVDECHHIPALSFESIMKKMPAKYFVGLTATPYRKDGHQAIIHMQCGPIRYEMEDFGAKLLNKEVIIRETNFELYTGDGRPEFHQLCEAMANDKTRNQLIVKDIIESLNEGKTPLIISERKDHLANLANILRSDFADVTQFILVGEMGKKARKETLEGIQACIDEKRKFYILSTGSFIGEGFDLPILDTLFLTMPIAFKGKLVQYSGRIHRVYEGKKSVRIYDYFDQKNGMTVSMFKKRVTTYKKMEYTIVGDGSKTNQLVFQRDMFSQFRV